MNVRASVTAVGWLGVPLLLAGCDLVLGIDDVSSATGPDSGRMTQGVSEDDAAAARDGSPGDEAAGRIEGGSAGALGRPGSPDAATRPDLPDAGPAPDAAVGAEADGGGDDAGPAP